jgi:LysM repeat protein
MVLRIVVLATVSLATSRYVAGGWGPPTDALTAQRAATLLADVMMTALVALLAWNAAAGALGRLRRRAGLVGRIAGAAWHLLVPAAMRAAATTAVAVGGVTGVGGLTPVVALDAAAPPDAALPRLDRPTTSAVPAAVPTTPAVAAVPDRVTVMPGDSLWRIAARHLGRDATTPAIAAHWPRWYEANRTRIGPDPNLIMVGTHLRPPAPERVAR